MTTPSLPQTVTSFADYFNSNAELEEVVAGLGYSFRPTEATLPRIAQTPVWGAELRENMAHSIPFLTLSSEQARREALIAPVLLALVRHLHVRLRFEYTLEISGRLRGTLDYLVLAERELLVIEAKNGDPTRGFKQLAAEMASLDQWEQTRSDTLYGVMSLGNVWQFGILERAQKRFTQDVNLFRVPADLDDLLRVLIAILGAPAPEAAS